MLTGDSHDCRRRARARHGVEDLPRRELVERTLEFARRIARLPTMTSLLIKESVNQTVDNMGFTNALDGVLHPPSAQPRPLGRGPRRRFSGGKAGRWDPAVERGTSGRPSPPLDGARRSIAPARSLQRTTSCSFRSMISSHVRPISSRISSLCSPTLGDARTLPREASSNCAGEATTLNVVPSALTASARYPLAMT